MAECGSLVVGAANGRDVTWAFGNVGGLVGAAMIDTAALTAAVVIGSRRGGRSLAALVALVGLLLCTTLGPGLLVDPWNPWVGLVPLYAFVC